MTNAIHKYMCNTVVTVSAEKVAQERTNLLTELHNRKKRYVKQDIRAFVISIDELLHKDNVVVSSNHSYTE